MYIFSASRGGYQVQHVISPQANCSYHQPGCNLSHEICEDGEGLKLPNLSHLQEVDPEFETYSDPARLQWVFDVLNILDDE